MAPRRHPKNQKASDGVLQRSEEFQAVLRVSDRPWRGLEGFKGLPKGSKGFDAVQVSSEMYISALQAAVNKRQA